MDLAYWRQRLRAGARSAAEEVIARLGALSPAARRAAVAWEFPDLETLTRSFEAAIGQGGPLGGAPFWVKDLFDVEGLPTRAGSSFLGEIRGLAAADARIVRRFREMGGTFAGKTHLHEFAYGLTGENPTFGDCYQSTQPERLTGGSSSGSAFLVQAGVAPVALGTDTGGSIRLPSAFCGIYGFRLVPGAPSIADAFPLAHSFDTAGWFTRSAVDMASVWRAWFPKTVRADLGRGVFLTLEDLSETATEVDRAVYELSERIAKRADRSTREELRAAWQGCEQAFAVIQSSEAYGIHERWLDARRAEYDPAVRARIDRGRNWSEGQIAEARARMARVRSVFAQLFRDFDFLVMPIAPFPAVLKSEADDAARSRILRLTAPASLGGLSALALPARLRDGMTTAVQVLLPKPDAPWVETLLERYGD